MNGKKLMRLGYYCLALVMIGCGGGGGGGSGIANTTASASPVNISGSVGDGPVTGATVRIYNQTGVQIAAVLSDNTATYKTSVNAMGSEYPLVLEVLRAR